jgi:hypothetical protein
MTFRLQAAARRPGRRSIRSPTRLHRSTGTHRLPVSDQENIAVNAADVSRRRDRRRQHRAMSDSASPSLIPPLRGTTGARLHRTATSVKWHFISTVLKRNSGT